MNSLFEVEAGIEVAAVDYGVVFGGGDDFGDRGADGEGRFESDD